MQCNAYEGLSFSDDKDKKAFVLFIRALMYKLAAYEGVCVEHDGDTFIVWHNPETETISIMTNEDNLQPGDFVWVHTEGDVEHRS
jgi:hypothetical protein